MNYEERAVLRASIEAIGAKKGADQFNEATASMRAGATATNSTLNVLKGTLGRLFTAYGAYRIVRYATDQFIEQERVLSQLRAGLESTNYISGQTVEGIKAIGDSMQDLTAYSNDAIMDIAAIGLSFTKITGDVFPQFLEISADVAARMGTDLKSTSIQLAKALNDPIANIGALSRAGIQFSKEQKETIKILWESNRIMEAQGVILKELENQYGGSAEAAKNTLGGALSGLKNETADLAKNMASTFAPSIQSGVEKLTGLMKFLNEELTTRNRLTSIPQWLQDQMKDNEAQPETPIGENVSYFQPSNAEQLAHNKRAQVNEFDRGFMDWYNDPKNKAGYDDVMSGTQQKREQHLKEIDMLIEKYKEFERIGTQAGNSVASALENIFVWGRDANEQIRQLIQNLIAMAFRETIGKSITSAFAGMFTAGMQTTDQLTAEKNIINNSAPGVTNKVRGDVGVNKGGTTVVNNNYNATVVAPTMSPKSTVDYFKQNNLMPALFQDMFRRNG